MSSSPSTSTMPRVSNIAANMAVYTANGGVIPPCPNEGCKNRVAVRHCDKADIPSFHNQCGRCKAASTKGKILPGIVFLKKRCCENSDGRLGFTCPVPAGGFEGFPSDCFHLDHKDSNHENNDHANLQTLCSLCHARKGKESGDFNGSKATSRKKKVAPVPTPL